MFLLLFFARHQQLGENHTDWPNYWGFPSAGGKKASLKDRCWDIPLHHNPPGPEQRQPLPPPHHPQELGCRQDGEKAGRQDGGQLLMEKYPQILPLIPRSRRRNKLHEHPLGQALILPAQPPDCPNCSYPGCACFGLAASFTAPSSNNQY